MLFMAQRKAIKKRIQKRVRPVRRVKTRPVQRARPVQRRSAKRIQISTSTKVTKKSEDEILEQELKKMRKDGRPHIIEYVAILLALAIGVLLVLIYAPFS